MATIMHKIRVFFQDLSIGSRIMTGFLIMAIFMAAVGFFGIYQMNRLAEITTRMYRHPLTVSNAVRDVNINIVRMHRSMKDVALTKDLESLEAAVQTIDRYEQEVYAAFDIIRERFLGDQQEIDQVIQVFRQWKPIRDEVIAFMKAGKQDEAAALTQGKGATHIELLQKEIQDLTDFASNKAEEFLTNTSSEAYQAYAWTLGLVGLAVFIGIGIAMRITRMITRPLQQAIRVANHVSEGNLSVQFHVNSRNELGQMLSAMQHMIAYIQEIATIAEKISNQQLDVVVTPKSKHDVLNHSLQRMVTTLQNMMDNINRSLTKTEQQNWLKDGLNQLNAGVLGKDSLQEICQAAVSFVARYVDAGHAVLYTHDADHHVLHLGGTFAMTENDQVAPTYRPGEGIIGQVARDRAPIFLNNLRRADQVITTGTVSEPPLNTYTFPLVYNEELYGVLEVASFELLDTSKQHFLDEANPVLATILFSALQRERMQTLLEQSQQAAKAAEISAHEAQNAREEAQQQSEELQRANARLEEQQQRLQQQSEELRQINVHLEEQQHEIQEQRDALREREQKLQHAQAELDRRSRELEAGTQSREEKSQSSVEQPPSVPSEVKPTDHSDDAPVVQPGDDRHTIRPGDKSILIIEDNADIAQSMLDIIREMDFKALIAFSGYDGLALAVRFRPTGILLDLMLPDLNGIEVLRELKRTRELRAIPVHIISGKDRDEALLQAGAIGYAQKPVSENDVQQAVNRLFEASQNVVHHILIVEDNDAQREAIQDLLREHPSISTYGVDSKSTAIPEIDSGRFDGAIIDLGLKDGSGYDICQYVKEQALDLPLIIYTGKDLTEDEERKLRQYTDSIIIKTAHSYERLQDEVSLFLHRVAPADPESANVPVQEPPQADTAIDLTGQKILIADDDIKNVFVLASVLEEHGATVVDARNGQEALETLWEEPDIDLVLMDVMMPNMDGYETMRAIRRDDALKALPIIAITAKTLIEDRQQCLEAGADDYLSKPVDYDGLLRLVKAWIDKA